MIPENSNNNSEMAALKTQVFVQLVALVVISTTLTIFLYRQASMASKDLNQITTLVTQNETAINDFVHKLVVYGEKHPDFVPVLKKYGLVPPAPGVSAGAPAKAAPVAPVAPKK